MNQQTSPLKLISVMLTITIICAGILAYVYQLTKDPIQKSKHSAEYDAINEVIVADFNNNPFDEKTTIGKDKLELYPARLDGVVTAFAIKTYSNEAYGGKIEMIVGFLLDGTVTGYKITSHQETPGLGTKVMEDKFKNQINGYNPGKETFKVKQDGGEIDAVTGATISSRAVIDAVQKAYDAYAKFTGGIINEED